jgi:hypothetical protein
MISLKDCRIESLGEVGLKVGLNKRMRGVIKKLSASAGYTSADRAKVAILVIKSQKELNPCGSSRIVFIILPCHARSGFVTEGISINVKGPAHDLSPEG